MKRKKPGRNVNNPRRSRRSAKKKFVQPRDLEQFLAMPERDQELWGDIGQIVTDVRDGDTLAHASRKFHKDSRKVREVVPSAFRKLKNGRWAAKKYDRILRVLPLPTRQGKIPVALNDSRQATVVGHYWNAVDRYRDTGDASALRQFRGKHVIDVDGKRVPLLTNLLELDRLGSAGDLSFESLYARVA